MKYIYRGILGACFMFAAQAQANVATTATNATSAESILADRLMQFEKSHPSAAAANAQALRADSGANPTRISLFANHLAPVAACNGSQVITFGDRYSMTYDAQAQKPCRIYDRSFPTLASMTGAQTVSKLPVQNFTAQDYLNWLDGKYDEVYSGVKTYQNMMKTPASASAVLQASWVSQLKFRSYRKAQLTWAAVGSSTIPTSFHASDLDLGTDFQFNAQQQGEMQDLLAQIKNEDPALFASAVPDAWQELVVNPNAILNRIRFIWNDVEKVYEVVMEGGFLPLSGPVAMVDFNQPYKPALQRFVRMQIEKQVMKLTTMIPGAVTQRIIGVVLNDTFQFVEGIYTYQMNLLEPVLRNAAAGDSNTTGTSNYDRALSILFSTRSSFFTDYIMAIIKGKAFDWNQIERLGQVARYKAEKQRDISVNNMNSKLALKSGCTTQLYHDYFAVCTKNGKEDGIYSLLSDTSVLFWSFGAPLVYRPATPAEVVMKRATTRILASGLRIVRLPILNFLTERLANELETYAMTGLYDEAFLRSSLLMQKHSTQPQDADQENILKWLYIQNINPFMPKSETSDSKIISATRIQPSQQQLTSDEVK
jgi:hypothetical protein